jgi:hypothetical protein
MDTNVTFLFSAGREGFRICCYSSMPAFVNLGRYVTQPKRLLHDLGAKLSRQSKLDTGERCRATCFGQINLNRARAVSFRLSLSRSRFSVPIRKRSPSRPHKHMKTTLIALLCLVASSLRANLIDLTPGWDWNAQGKIPPALEALFTAEASNFISFLTRDALFHTPMGMACMTFTGG